MTGPLVRFTAKVFRVEESMTDLEDGVHDVRYKVACRSATGERAVLLRKEPFVDAVRPGVGVEVVVRAIAAAPAGESS